MNKEQFLEMLTAQLQVLDEKEKRDILDEYALHIDMKVSEGLSEEEAIQDFGDIKELVADILEAYHVNPEFCAPTKVKKKEWKTPDIGKVKEEGIEACTKAGGFLKRKMKACGEKFRNAFRKCGMFFKGLRKKGLKKQMKEEKERHIIRDIFIGCKTAIVWTAKFIWSMFCFLVAMMCVLTTAAALFSFGVLIIWKVQGYPLTGLTLGSFGVMLMFGSLTGLSLSFRRKKYSIKKLQLTLAGVFGAGVLLTGVGTGVTLKEYASLAYSGEHIIGETDMQTQSGEIKFEKTNEDGMYHIYCGADEFEVVEDDSVTEKVVKYEAVYNKNSVGLDVHGEPENGYFSIVSWWKGASDFEQIMSCKDEVLKELKENKIGSYRMMEIQKVKFVVNPQTAKMLYVE